MAVIVTCSCQAKLRLPDDCQGKLLRCPRCQAELVATADNQVVTLPPGVSPAVGGSCPICQSSIDPDEVALTCPDCRQVHHRECWAEVGGCSTYGCPKAPVLVKDESAGQPPRSAWGDTKKCPVCAETIKAIALRCRYCGTDFETVDPLTVADLRKREHTKESLQGMQKGVWALFIISLLGCTAPLLFFINLAWFLPKRQQLARSGPFYVVLGFASLVITIIYNVLILCFMLFSRG
jgi:hypothetical protein